MLFLLFSLPMIGRLEITMMNIVSFISFVVYTIIIYNVSRQEDDFYSNKNLATLVFFVSVIGVICYHLLSLYISHDTFVFSKADAMVYHLTGLRTRELSPSETIKYIMSSTRLGFDDWGALLWVHFVYKIIPSQQFLCLIHCAIGTITSILIFNIGRFFMPRKYAFMAAISFSLASFSIVHYSQCLKETIMVMIIVASFYLFVRFLKTNEKLSLTFSFVFAGLIFFFRIPIALLIIFSFGLALVLLYAKGTPAVILGVLLAIGICATPLYDMVFQRYLRGGDVVAIMERKNELADGGGIVNQLADPLAALAGPFPSVKIHEIKQTPLYAAGLLYRFLLCGPFILAVFQAIREKSVKMYPLIIFFLVSAIGVAISVKGLEARLSIPHLPMMYILAFWFLAKYDYKQLEWQISYPLQNVYIAGILGLCLLWNFR